MGLRRLKKKTKLNYRRGNTAHDCSECNYFIRDFDVKNINGKHRAFEPRCIIMGLKDGRSYKINPHNICDKHDNSAYLKRLRGY